VVSQRQRLLEINTEQAHAIELRAGTALYGSSAMHGWSMLQPCPERPNAGRLEAGPDGGRVKLAGVTTRSDSALLRLHAR
jgi:hypothetical protein